MVTASRCSSKRGGKRDSRCCYVVDGLPTWPARRLGWKHVQDMFRTQLLLPAFFHKSCPPLTAYSGFAWTYSYYFYGTESVSEAVRKTNE